MKEADFRAYRDGDSPILRDSGVLFLDVLGTTAMAISPRAIQHLRRLRPALQEAAERAAVNESGLQHASTWFTDNLVVGTPVIGPIDREQALGWLEVSSAYILLICAEHGFLARGAIALGDHYMDPHFVFGPALVEAVQLEKSARWPRVVLSPKAVEAERHHTEAYYGGGEHAVQRGCLLRDGDGTVFVDHLGIYLDEEDDPNALDHYVGRHQAAIASALTAHAGEAEIHDKWRWLAEYHNHTITSRLRDPDRFLIEVESPTFSFGPFAPDIKAKPVEDVGDLIRRSVES